MPIQLNDFRARWSLHRDAVMAAVERVGASGWWILGEEVEAFEASLAEAWPCGHAVGVASGLDAIEIGLRCAGLRPGERVLTTPLSAFATSLAVLRAGGVPVFVDVDAGGQLDLALAAEVLERHADIRFLLPVHLYGHAMDLEALDALVARRPVAIVEDCAQAIGARSRGRAVGTLGAFAATSFYPTKNLGAMGDAGAVLTGDAAGAARARRLRDYGQGAKFEHDERGLNSRLDALQAAILRDAFLPALAAETTRRVAIAARYREGIRHPGVVPLPAPAGSESVWHLFPVRVAGDRGAFRSHLTAAGVESGVHYPKLIPEQAALSGLPADAVLTPLARAKGIAEAVVSLPIHPALRDEEVARVIEAVNAWPEASA